MSWNHSTAGSCVAKAVPRWADTGAGRDWPCDVLRERLRVPRGQTIVDGIFDLSEHCGRTSPCHSGWKPARVK
jgi:hypothetical protein